MLSSARQWFAARLRDDPGRFSLAIPMTAGAMVAPMDFAERLAGRIAPPFLVAVGILVGAYATLLGLLLHSSLILLGGRLMGGRARAVDLRAALGWGALPLVVLSAFTLLSLPLLGSTGLEIEPWLHPGRATHVVRIALACMQLTCAVATVVLTYTFAGVAHGFSTFRAVVAHIGGICIVVLPIVIVALVYDWRTS